MELKTTILKRMILKFHKGKIENDIEKEVLTFITSRVEKFKRIDYDLTLELISNKKNISIFETKKIINKYLTVQNKLVIHNSSFCFNSNQL